MDDTRRYARISAGFGTRVAGVDDWDAPTPCPEWTVRQLVRHVIDTHHRVLGTTPTASEQPPQQWRRAQTSLTDALADPARSAAVLQTFGGEMTFAQMVGGLVCADVLLHTWDLARATGQDEGLDGEAVAEVHAFLLPIDGQLRAPGGFGPRLDPPSGADPQTSFLAFAGRRV